jgi:hypothetical protein
VHASPSISKALFIEKQNFQDDTQVRVHTSPLILYTKLPMISRKIRFINEFLLVIEN